MAQRGDGVSSEASASESSRWAIVGDVPSLTVVYLAVVTTGALVAGWFGWTTLRSSWASAGLLAGAAVVVVALVHNTRPASEPISRRALAALSVPAVGVLVGIVALALSSVSRRLEWFLNGDHTRHIVFVVDTWFTGGLRYTQAQEAYPRGWHSFLAAAWSTLGAGDQPADLLRLLIVASVASLLLSAVLALSTAHLTMVLGARLGLGDQGRVVAGVVASSLTLLNFAFANFQALGFETALLSALVITVCMREVLARPGSAWSVIVTWSGVAVVAHSWQLVLPPVVALALFSLHKWWIAASPPRVVVLMALGSALVTTATGIVAVQRFVGVGATTSIGPDTPVPAALLVAGAVSMLWLAVRARDVRVSISALAGLLPAVTGLGIAALQGVSAFSYYPSKLMWHSAVACLPALVVAAGLVVRGLSHHVRVRTVVRGVAGATAALIVAYGLLMPWGAFLGIWSTVDGERALAALQTPGADRAQVVWLGSTPITDAVTRSLLDAYRARPVAKAPQAPLSVVEECRLLESATSPAVLSTEAPVEVRARYSCVANLDIVPVAVTR